MKGIYVKIKDVNKISKFKELFIDLFKKYLILNVIGAWLTMGLWLLVIAAKAAYDTFQTKNVLGVETFLPWKDLTIEIPSQQQDILVLNKETVITFTNKKEINRNKYAAFLKKMALISENTTINSNKLNDVEI